MLINLWTTDPVAYLDMVANVIAQREDPAVDFNFQGESASLKITVNKMVGSDTIMINAIIESAFQKIQRCSSNCTLINNMKDGLKRHFSSISWDAWQMAAVLFPEYSIIKYDAEADCFTVSVQLLKKEDLLEALEARPNTNRKVNQDKIDENYNLMSTELTNLANSPITGDGTQTLEYITKKRAAVVEEIEFTGSKSKCMAKKDVEALMKRLDTINGAQLQFANPSSPKALLLITAIVGKPGHACNIHVRANMQGQFAQFLKNDGDDVFFLGYSNYMKTSGYYFGIRKKDGDENNYELITYHIKDGMPDTSAPVLLGGTCLRLYPNPAMPALATNIAA